MTIDPNENRRLMVALGFGTVVFMVVYGVFRHLQ
jgi:hypothetical protein